MHASSSDSDRLLWGCGVGVRKVDEGTNQLPALGLNRGSHAINLPEWAVLSNTKQIQQSSSCCPNRT